MLESANFLLFSQPLAEFGEPYMFTGNVAISVYSERNSGDDVDLVINLPESRITEFIRLFFPEQFFVPPREIIALERSREQRGHITLLAFRAGIHADIFFPGIDPLVAWGLSQAKTIRVGDSEIRVAPPEYLILQKLFYFSETLSSKHMLDIDTLLKQKSLPLDMQLLAHWVSKKGLGKAWDLALSTSTNARS